MVLFSISRGIIYTPIMLFLIVFTISSSPINGIAVASAAKLCKEGKNDLIGSYDVIQGKGGLWGLMEQVAELKEKSVLGLQADGKLRRTVSIFEEMCEDGKKPTPGLYNEIQDLIGNGRMVFNMNPDKTPPKQILEEITAVNRKAAALLAKLGE